MFLSENQSDWDEHLPLLMMAFRPAFHETTGYTPYEMMLGRQIGVPIDIFLGRPKPEEASGPLASERQKRRYDHGAHKRLCKQNNGRDCNAKIKETGPQTSCGRLRRSRRPLDWSTDYQMTH